jgi:flagellar basal body-associated protein FliL
MSRIRDRKKSDTKREKKSTGKLAGIIIISVVLILVTSIIYSFVSVSSGQIKRNKDNLCRVDGQYNKHVVVLDITGRYSLIQHKTIRSSIEDIVKNLKLDEQLQLYFITDNVTSAVKPLMEVCNPGKGENIDGLVGNKKLIIQKWKNKLYEPLNKILSDFDATEQITNSSPIFETIQMINNLSLKKSKVDTKIRFTVISDFIQHSKEYSFLRNNKIEKFWTSNYYQKIYTTFKDVDISLLFIRRDGYEKYINKKYLDFWKKYFIKSGSKNVIIGRLEG